MKTRRKIVCLIITMALLLPAFSNVGSIAFATETVDIWDGTVATGFESGTGTEVDPYIIKTPEQLAYLASTVNAGTTYDGVYFRLASDIYLNDTTDWENWDTTPPKNMWTPIGTNHAEPFSGTFDGDGHAVLGIYTDGAEYYQALFGRISGTVQNLGIEDSYISGFSYVAGVCGYNYYGAVINCYNTGTIRSTDYYSNFTAGICGNSYEGGKVSGCRNSGTIIGGYEVGGICGCISHTSSLTGSYNTGTISGNYCVGGVCGYNECAAITDCYNTGTVSAVTVIAGGVCADNREGTATGCYNVGAVSGSAYVGGIYGHSDNSTAANCYYLSGCAKDSSGTVQYGIGSETAGQTIEDLSGSTTGLTNADMKLKEKFVGFDFENVWTVSPTDSDYPILAWQKTDNGVTQETTETVTPDTEKADDKQTISPAVIIIIVVIIAVVIVIGIVVWKMTRKK